MTTKTQVPPEPDRGWEVIRARDSKGGTYTTTRHLAHQAGHEVLEGRPATDDRGNWLPDKPKETIQEIKTKTRTRRS